MIGTNQHSRKSRPGRTFLLLAAVFALAGISARQETTAGKLPQASAVLDRFVEVTGGVAAYQKLHNQAAEGTIEFVQPKLNGKIAAYQAEPNYAYSIITFEGLGNVEEGTDGEIAWERTAEGARIKSGTEKAEALRDAAFNGRVRWRELYLKAECVASEEVEGKACYKIVLTPETGNPVAQYYDSESGLLVKSSAKVASPAGDVARDTWLSDYRKIEGVLVPFEVRHVVTDQEIRIHLTSIRFNVDLPADRFRLPPEVEALVKQ